MHSQKKRKKRKKKEKKWQNSESWANQNYCSEITVTFPIHSFYI